MQHTQNIDEYHIPSYIHEYEKKGKIRILEKPAFIPMEIIEIDLESNIIREASVSYTHLTLPTNREV